MKRVTGPTLVASLILGGLAGCGEQASSSTKQETKISTPAGTTTITVDKEVRKSGDEPPAVKP